MADVRPPTEDNLRAYLDGTTAAEVANAARRLDRAFYEAGQISYTQLQLTLELSDEELLAQRDRWREQEQAERRKRGLEKIQLLYHLLGYLDQ